ncbi:unnamed protein product [Schistosoma haematobium]|nr:unnamed protein product [Schistosoma haematobium]
METYSRHVLLPVYRRACVSFEESIRSPEMCVLYFMVVCKKTYVYQYGSKLKFVTNANSRRLAHATKGGLTPSPILISISPQKL